MNSDKSMQQLMDEFVGESCIPEKRDSAQQEIKGLFMKFMGTLAFHTLKLSPPSSSTSESPPPQARPRHPASAMDPTHEAPKL